MAHAPAMTAVERTVERWARARLGQLDHEHRVAQIAATVFDLTAPLHALSRGPLSRVPLSRVPLSRGPHPRLLRLASLVHDVGRSIDAADHPAHGAAMLLSDTSLPLSAADRRALAYLTLHHRGEVPAIGDDDVLHPDDDHPALRQTLALLRCADALDSRSQESPQLVFALLPGTGRQRPTLHITCYLQTPTEKARRTYTRRKKFRLLEETTGVRVEVEVSTAQSLRLVA